MTAVLVSGEQQFAKLAKSLRGAANKGLRRELQKGIDSAARPAVVAARREVRALPAVTGQHTRLRARTSGAVRVQTINRGRAQGVRIRVAEPKGLGLLPRRMNRGRWRHPVFGNRDVWVTQTMPRGWFDRPMHEAAPRARTGVELAMRGVAEQVERLR